MQENKFLLFSNLDSFFRVFSGADRAAAQNPTTGLRNLGCEAVATGAIEHLFRLREDPQNGLEAVRIQLRINIVQEVDRYSPRAAQDQPSCGRQQQAKELLLSRRGDSSGLVTTPAKRELVQMRPDEWTAYLALRPRSFAQLPRKRCR